MRRFLNSLGFAWSGVKYVVKSEANMQIHMVAALCTILLSYYLELSSIEWSIILIAIVLVIGAEILNTIIEKYLDFYHPSRSNQVKILKDMAAAFVLFQAFIACIIGFIIFLPKIIALLGMNL